MSVGWHSHLIHNETCLDRSESICAINRTLTFLRLSSSAGCQGCTIVVLAIEQWCRTYVAESQLRILSLTPNPENIFDERDIQGKFSWCQGPNGGVLMLNLRFWEGEYNLTNLGGKLQIFREPGDSARVTERKGFGEFIICWGEDGKSYEYDGGGKKAELYQLVGAGRILLDVGYDLGLSRVKLVENPTQKAQYIALSHCWGKHVPSTTIQESLERRKASISISELPNTFQHAVALCRKLGIRYLWIDSLCIIQDSPTDWQTESSKMHKVYSNASLVIAATRSPDSTHGLFHTRSLSEKVIKNFYTIPSTKGEEAVSVNVRFNEDSACHKNFHIADTKLENFPLLTRTWCLQERILATRVLHFCDEELVWECHTSVKCECMGHDASRSSLSSFKQRWALIMSNITGFDVETGTPEHGTGNQAPEGKERSKGKSNVYEAWHIIVNTASKLQIRKESDRLPALSGMAQKMIENGAGAYAAGLWEENMKRDLLWAATCIVVSRRDFRETRHADKWRAPSWSWASMESAEISFPNNDTYDDDYDVNISEVKIRPLNGNPTSNVTAGSLKIEGLVTECLLGREFKEHLQKYHGRTLHLDVPGSEQQMLCSMICDTAASSEKENGPVGRKVLTLLMRRYRRDPNSNDPTPFHALVLRESRGLSGRERERGCYERIGIVQWDRLDPLFGKKVKWEKWFANAERRTLILI